MVAVPPSRSPTLDAIWSVYEEQQENRQRTYLGASQMGNECDRALWYAFRWANEPERLTGRKIRLFETGHREEERLIADLEKVPEITVVGRQTGFSDHGGHFKGHLDGIVIGLLEAPKTRHVLECKTHNDKSFKELMKDGVQKSKPAHWTQMQLYMHYTGLERALYMAVNKNDDSIILERVHYDKGDAEAAIKRAERIVFSDRPPAKLHEDPKAPMAFVCGWCPSKAVCHDNAFALRNCRTCISATVDHEDGWHCEHWHKDLTVLEQQAGCPRHLYNPNLVPGEQFDASEEGRWVIYNLRSDGSTFVDGGSDV